MLEETIAKRSIPDYVTSVCGDRHHVTGIGLTPNQEVPCQGGRRANIGPRILARFWKCVPVDSPLFGIEGHHRRASVRGIARKALENAAAPEGGRAVELPAFERSVSPDLGAGGRVDGAD